MRDIIQEIANGIKQIYESEGQNECSPEVIADAIAAYDEEILEEVVSRLLKDGMKIVEIL